MRYILLSALLLGSILGCGRAAQADEVRYRFEAAGAALHALSPGGSRILIAALPGPIDSLLSVGSLLYVVYAKQYIEVADVSNPVEYKRRATLTPLVDVAKLHLGSDGSSTLLLTTTDGATAAYSLADPLHPVPLLGSPPLKPVSAGRLKELAAQTYRDYRSIHPMIGPGIAVTLIGGALLAGGAYLLGQPETGSLLPVRSLVGFPLTISGGLHIVLGGTFVLAGVLQQKRDKRLRRPLY